MKKFTFNEYGELFVGTTREIRSLYKNLARKTNAFPRFVDMPILREDRMYGIHVEEDGEYTVLNASTVLATLLAE